MIKIIWTACLCLFALAYSVKAQSPIERVEISGISKMKKPKLVKLFKVVEGKSVEIATAMPEEQGGRFGFLFHPEYEGLYLIGSGYAATYNENYKFYFKGGEKLSLTLLDTCYHLNGNLNSKENVILTQWYDLIASVQDKSVNFGKRNSTYVDFFPLVEEMNIKSKTFLNGKSSGNIKFQENMKNYMKWDLAGYAANFITSPRTAYPKEEDYSPYFSALSLKEFSKSAEIVYANPYGFKTLFNLTNMMMRQQKTKTKLSLESILAAVANDTLKGDFVLNAALETKNYKQYTELMDVNAKYMLTASQKKKDHEKLASLVLLRRGDDAFNFSFPDHTGKLVRMSDFKGKVVLIDMWATWCVPCLNEIPHLKKLDEEMKGKDVVLVSISMDDFKDKEKWLKMIKTKNMGGIQLLAGPTSDITKYYSIKAIPQFMVFDKQGKIVTINAPLPSTPNLKTLLEKTLVN